MNTSNYAGRILLFTVTALASAIACAQTPSTLKDAVELAVDQNPEVKLRFHNLQAAVQERKAAEGAWLPSLDLEVVNGNYETLRPDLSAPYGYDGNRASLLLRQILFDGMATAREVRRLSYSQQAAYYDLLSVSNSTGLEVARAYLDVLRYRELVTLAATNFTNHQEVRDRLEQKARAGVGRKVDLEQANGRQALAESNWLTEVSNLHDVSARYQRLVGVLPAADLQPPAALTASSTSGTTFLVDAVRRNPDFLGSVATIRAYRADASVRRAGYYPTVELRARQSTEVNQAGVTGDYRDTALELVLNYNLFRGGSDKARISQYRSKLDSAFDLRDKTCRDLWQTGEIAYNDFKRMDGLIALLSQHELSTSKARQAYQQQFEIGQRSLLDLLDTENELYQARRALANAQYDQQLVGYRLQATNGTLLSALQLQPLSIDDQNSPGGGTDADDDLMLCNNQLPNLPTLDRTADVPALPVELVAPVPVVAAEPAPVPKAVPNACAQLPDVVQGWIASWNAKQTSNYLSYYAQNFTPALGLSHNAWENLRKKRITKQGDIKAEITDIQPLSCDAKSAEVAFKQEYGSVDYRDHVEKVLSLQQTDGAWKIVRETVTKGRTY